MRVAVYDLVEARLAQDPGNTYLGVVTCIRQHTGLDGPDDPMYHEPVESIELDGSMVLLAGPLQHHSDTERVMIYPDDRIERVISLQEAVSDGAAMEFVRSVANRVSRLVSKTYGDAMKEGGRMNEEKELTLAQARAEIEKLTG